MRLLKLTLTVHLILMIHFIWKTKATSQIRPKNYKYNQVGDNCETYCDVQNVDIKQECLDVINND